MSVTLRVTGLGGSLREDRFDDQPYRPLKEIGAIFLRSPAPTGGSPRGGDRTHDAEFGDGAPQALHQRQSPFSAIVPAEPDTTAVSGARYGRHLVAVPQRDG